MFLYISENVTWRLFEFVFHVFEKSFISCKCITNCCLKFQYLCPIGILELSIGNFNNYNYLYLLFHVTSNINNNNNIQKQKRPIGFLSRYNVSLFISIKIINKFSYFYHYQMGIWKQMLQQKDHSLAPPNLICLLSRNKILVEYSFLMMRE